MNRITVKTINGYNITKLEGTRGHYEVTLEQTPFARKYVTFRTVKAATEYILNIA